MRGLLGQRLDQMRMGMAEGIDRDAGPEIEISLAISRRKARVPPPSRRKRRRAHRSAATASVTDRISKSGPDVAGWAGKRKRRPAKGGTAQDSIGAKSPVNSREMKRSHHGERVPSGFEFAWGKRHGWHGDSCAGVSASSRFRAVEYDSSCGGFHPQERPKDAVGHISVRGA